MLKIQLSPNLHKLVQSLKGLNSSTVFDFSLTPRQLSNVQLVEIAAVELVFLHKKENKIMATGWS
jgi:hypothetical protein